MDNNTTTYSNSQTPRRSERSTSCPRLTRHQQHFMGPSHWSPLVRYVGTFPAVSDLSSSIPGMGPSRGVPSHPGNPRPRSGEKGQIQTCRVFHRRDLCGGEKRRSSIGKTKRGKKTKRMMSTNCYSTFNGGPTTFISCSLNTFSISTAVGGEVQASVTLKNPSIFPAGRYETIIFPFSVS